jgi:hypothetical protein
MPSTINASASSGLITTADTSTILQLQTGGTTAVTVDASQNVGIGTSSPSTPLHVTTSTTAFQPVRVQNTNTSSDAVAAFDVLVDGVGGWFSAVSSTNTNVGYGGRGSTVTLATNASNTQGGLALMARNAAGYMTFHTGGNTERARIDSSGNVGIGTSSPTYRLHLDNIVTGDGIAIQDGNDSGSVGLYFLNGSDVTVGSIFGLTDNTGMSFQTNGSERARIDSSGQLLVGKTAGGIATAGFQAEANGSIGCTRSANTPLQVNRLTDDGTLVSLQQATVQEGSISVSGTTVSYNGGHLSRWAQTTTDKDESLVKGTVLSNLDEMNVYTDSEGNPVDNEQLNKVKVSDVEGDVNVAGVFVNWTHDDAHNVDEINMAMTGDMIIRIAQGVTVARGDLLMSAGDGTAKPQGDDIIRSKTVAKVTSTHVTCTYADGSYCVPCVLMAC